MEGSVEEIDTGKQARFISGVELLGFLRERFVQMPQIHQEKEETDERNDERQ